LKSDEKLDEKKPPEVRVIEDNHQVKYASELSIGESVEE
jgi:hypothetical protein